MNITNIKIREVKDKGNFKAGISATINDLSINDMKLMQGQNGLFISMPSREYMKDNEKKYSSIVFLTKEQKAELLEAVLNQMNGQAPEVTPQSFNNEEQQSDPFEAFGNQIELSEDDIAF